MFSEILRQRYPILVLRHVTKPVQIAVDAGRRWTEPRHDRSARWAAQWSGTMGLFKENALLCERINVRRLRLGMSSEAADPIVQIVDSDEQDVGPIDGVGVSLLVRLQKERDCQEACSGTRQEFRCLA